MRRLLFVAIGAFFIAAAVLPTQRTFIVQAVSEGERLSMYSKPAVVRLIDGAQGQLVLQLPCYLCRSEERRVGKECRSRWSPYH